MTDNVQPIARTRIEEIRERLLDYAYKSMLLAEMTGDQSMRNALRKFGEAFKEADKLLASQGRRIAALEQALKAVTDGMDLAGGDAYGDAECPWCHAGHDGSHEGDCGLVAARQLLPLPRGPQG